MGEMLKKKTFYSWNQNCASAEVWVLLANLKTKGAPLAVKLEQFCSGWYSRAGICHLRPVRSLGPSMEMSSPSLHWRQKGHWSMQETLKVQGLPGWRPLSPCSVLWDCAAPRAHASTRAQAAALSSLPAELQRSLEQRAVSQSLGLWAASKEEGILPLSKVKACLQKNLSGTNTCKS